MNILRFIGRSREFERKLEQSRSRLHRLAYSWCRSQALADDLVQEAMSKALGRSDQLRDLEAMHSWLFSILANCWRDHFRGSHDCEDIDEIEEHHLADETTPEDQYLQNEVVRRVRSAVAALPLGQRQVVTLVDLEECTYAEVAAILEIPVGTVMSRLSRARQALKERLLDRKSEPAAPHLSRVK